MELTLPMRREKTSSPKSKKEKEILSCQLKYARSTANPSPVRLNNKASLKKRP